MPNTHEHTPGVEALIADFHQKQIRYKRRQRHACAACGESGDHGIDSNHTHQFDDGMDTYDFPDGWLRENFTTHHQKSIEAVVARLEDMKVDLFEYKKLLCHPTSGCNKTNRRINMHGKKQHNQALNDAITIIRDTLKS